ncbi:hypothetical protein ACKFKF_10155 [Phormidesmis sp. 146-12]
MSKGKKEDDVFRQIFERLVVPVLVAILVGSSLPWWWPKIDDNTADEPPPNLLLTTGRYGRDGSLFRGTSRIIAKVGGKMCIALVNGTPTPYRGNSEIVISSLSWSDGKLHVDATSEQLVILNRTSFRSEIDSRDSWKLETEKIENSYRTRLNTCLESDGKYKYSGLGNFIDGIPFPNP